MAVKKDRAAEAFLAVGSKFVVNILAEGKEKPVIKQLLKPFKPGEDRYSGLDVQVAAAGYNAPVLFPNPKPYALKPYCSFPHIQPQGDVTNEDQGAPEEHVRACMLQMQAGKVSCDATTRGLQTGD